MSEEIFFYKRAKNINVFRHSLFSCPKVRYLMPKRKKNKRIFNFAKIYKSTPQCLQ